MYAMENYNIEYEENSFYNKLTKEEQARYLQHVMAVKYKIWIHQFDHLLKKPKSGRPIKEKKYTPSRPYENV